MIFNMLTSQKNPRSEVKHVYNTSSEPGSVARPWSLDPAVPESSAQEENEQPTATMRKHAEDPSPSEPVQTSPIKSTSHQEANTSSSEESTPVPGLPSGSSEPETVGRPESQPESHPPERVPPSSRQKDVPHTGVTADQSPVAPLSTSTQTPPSGTEVSSWSPPSGWKVAASATPTDTPPTERQSDVQTEDAEKPPSVQAPSNRVDPPSTSVPSPPTGQPYAAPSVRADSPAQKTPAQHKAAPSREASTPVAETHTTSQPHLPTQSVEHPTAVGRLPGVESPQSESTTASTPPSTSTPPVSSAPSGWSSVPVQPQPVQPQPVQEPPAQQTSGHSQGASQPVADVKPTQQTHSPNPSHAPPRRKQPYFQRRDFTRNKSHCVDSSLYVDPSGLECSLRMVFGSRPAATCPAATGSADVGAVAGDVATGRRYQTDAADAFADSLA